jgi:GAF domain-containing protein
MAALKRELSEEREIRRALVDSSIRLNSTLNVSELLQTIITSATQLVDAEAGSVLIYDDVTQELSFEAAAGETSERIKAQRMPANTGIAGWVLQHQKPVIVNEAHQDRRFSGSIDGALGFVTHSLLAAPLKARDHMVGVIELVNKRHNRKFSARDLEIAGAFGAQAAVAIDNAHLYGKLADTVVQSRMTYRL